MMIEIPRGMGKRMFYGDEDPQSRPGYLRLTFVDPSCEVNIPGQTGHVLQYFGTPPIVDKFWFDDLILSREASGPAKFGRVELLQIHFMNDVQLGVRCIPTFISDCAFCGTLHGVSWGPNATSEHVVMARFCDRANSPYQRLPLSPWPLNSPEGAESFDPALIPVRSKGAQ